jgi:predicted O-methyltransferase YrrM
MNVNLIHWEDKLQALSEIKPVIKEIQSLGMCGSPQPEYLFCLSYSLSNRGEIVEIGTCAGTSLIVLSLAQKLKQEGRIVHTVDLSKHESLESNLDRANVKDWVNIIIGNSADIAKSWHKPLELLWIDGDHSYEGVLSDINNWEKFVLKGGMIAFHDYRNGTGVSRAIHDSLLSKPHVWRVISDREYGSIFVIERISNEGETNPWIDSLSIHQKKQSPASAPSFLNRITRLLTGQ